MDDANIPGLVNLQILSEQLLVFDEATEQTLAELEIDQDDEDNDNFSSFLGGGERSHKSSSPLAESITTMIITQEAVIDLVATATQVEKNNVGTATRESYKNRLVDLILWLYNNNYTGVLSTGYRTRLAVAMVGCG